MRNTATHVPLFAWTAMALCFAPGLASAGTRPTPARELSDKALSAKELPQRVTAAVALSMLAGPDVAAQLRRVAAECKDAEVIFPALSGLMIRSDGGSLLLFVAALERREMPLCQVGVQGVLKVTGLNVEKMGYKADDPDEQRNKAVRRLRELLEKGNAKSPP